MAVLSDSDRAELHALFMSDTSRERQTIAGLSKPDLRAAVNAADDWAEANKAAYNNALPVAARTALTAAQKAQLLMYVIRRRYVVGA